MKQCINIILSVLLIQFLFTHIAGEKAFGQPDKSYIGRGHEGDENIITGRVKYIIASTPPETTHAVQGKVKLFRVNPPGFDVALVDSASINSLGYYSVYGFPPGAYYIVAYPNDKVEDFIISFYPSGQLWTSAVRVNVSPGQVRTCNIISQEMFQTPGATPVSGEVADSTNHNIKLRNSIITAKSGEQYRGFAITDNQGRYIVNSILPGNYNLTVTRFGFKNQTQNVNIGTSSATVNFYLPKDTSYSIGIENNAAAIKNFRLFQNYPNPFNPSTEISFTLEKGMNVRLSVYSVEGKLIKELLSEYKNPGDYRVNFAAENLNSGIYPYILEGEGGQRESKFMVFIK
ncbi:MAG: carboxypeptidase regulatory-like domain-containing protein [Ignavibacteria bacterium]|nr:carboxypeptidase regulatory-like domain-containing protein [Ignavibacteria bacterium]